MATSLIGGGKKKEEKKVRKKQKPSWKQKFLVENLERKTKSRIRQKEARQKKS